MIFVNMHEAKTQLSHYVAMVSDSNEAVTICKNGKPMATLNPYAPPKKGIVFGGMKGRIWVSDDFDDPLPDEIQRYFE
jgi:prevent-host-death family protein